MAYSPPRVSSLFKYGHFFPRPPPYHACPYECAFAFCFCQCGFFPLPLGFFPPWGIAFPEGRKGLHRWGEAKMQRQSRGCCCGADPPHPQALLLFPPPFQDLEKSGHTVHRTLMYPCWLTGIKLYKLTQSQQEVSLNAMQSCLICTLLALGSA